MFCVWNAPCWFCGLCVSRTVPTATCWGKRATLCGRFALGSGYKYEAHDQTKVMGKGALNVLRRELVVVRCHFSHCAAVGCQLTSERSAHRQERRREEGERRSNTFGDGPSADRSNAGAAAKRQERLSRVTDRRCNWACASASASSITGSPARVLSNALPLSLSHDRFYTFPHFSPLSVGKVFATVLVWTIFFAFSFRDKCTVQPIAVNATGGLAKCQQIILVDFFKNTNNYLVCFVVYRKDFCMTPWPWMSVCKQTCFFTYRRIGIRLCVFVINISINILLHIIYAVTITKLRLEI